MSGKWWVALTAHCIPRTTDLICQKLVLVVYSARLSAAWSRLGVSRFSLLAM